MSHVSLKSFDPYIDQLLNQRYQIRKILGYGSMGIVYEAEQIVLQKVVAVKIVRPELAGDELVKRRFKLESRAASRIHHPNVINILDFGETDHGDLFMVMEFVNGLDLHQVLKADYPLSPHRVVSILSQVCAALDEAHSLSVIHRDLKPANILVDHRRTQEDFVKVLDFGIAKIQDSEVDADGPLTRDGMVCGTPAFMSPEQVQGKGLDNRSDIFSLGVIFYLMLTAQLPFNADTSVDMAVAILRKKPNPPSRLRIDLPIEPELERICLKALEKNPDNRYRSAHEMKLDLEEAIFSFGRTNTGERFVPSMERVVGNYPIDEGLQEQDTEFFEASDGVPQKKVRTEDILPTLVGVPAVFKAVSEESQGMTFQTRLVLGLLVVFLGLCSIFIAVFLALFLFGK